MRTQSADSDKTVREGRPAGPFGRLAQARSGSRGRGFGGSRRWAHGWNPEFGPWMGGRGFGPGSEEDPDAGEFGPVGPGPGGFRTGGRGEFGRGPFGRGPFGPGGFGPGGFGPGGPGGRGGWGGGRGPGGGRGRRPRGNVRAAILALLLEEPRHGYSIMTELTERSGGLWRPSPGSVYPVLQQLQDEGLVSAEESEGRKVFSLTESGRALVQANPAEFAEPWSVAGPGPRQRVQTLFEGMTALGSATQQVARLGSAEQAERARAVLDEARRALYRILSEEDGPAAAGPATAAGWGQSSDEDDGDLAADPTQDR